VSTSDNSRVDQTGRFARPSTKVDCAVWVVKSFLTQISHGS